MENYLNNVGLILVSMVFDSVFRPCFLVFDLSGSEVCLKVLPGLVGGRFVILLFDCVGEDACFCDDCFFQC